MYRKTKKKLAITVVFFFLSTLFYNLAPITEAYADTTATVGAYNVALSAPSATSGGKATINGTISVGNQNGNFNQPITITIPSGLTNVSLNSSGLTGYFKATQNGNQITLTPLSGVSTLYEATFSLTGNLAKDMGPGNHNIPATVNGQSVPVPITVTSPGGGDSGSGTNPGASGSGSDGGYVPPPPTVNGLNGVNLNQPIGKYFLPTKIGGKYNQSQTIPILNGGNNVVTYAVFVNSNLASGNTFVDNMPEGMSYVQGSVSVTNMNNNTKIPINMTGEGLKETYNNNQLELSGFSSLGNAIYKVTYQAVISLAYAQKHFNTTLSNVGSFANHTSTAKLTINTEKTSFNPSHEDGMINKTVNQNVFGDGVNSLKYTLTINPHNYNISNAKVIDKMPAGIILQPVDANPYSSNYGNVSVNVYKNGQYQSAPFNICQIDANGNQSYPFGQYPANQALGTLYYNEQTNEISVDVPSTNDEVVVSYSVNIGANAKNIVNTAKITNNGVSDSSTAVSQYASNSTALGMWKTASWKDPATGQIVNSSDIVNNKCDLNINGAQNPDVTFIINVQNNNAYFPNGQLSFRDPIEKGVKILSVDVPSNMGYTIKDNTVYFKNTGYVEPGQFQVKINCSLADFKGGSTITNTAYKNNWATDTVTVHKQSNTNVQQYGSLTITKTGVNDTKLNGATFNVTGPNNFNENVTTTSNGTVDLTKLPYGTYTVKETKAPTGYTLNPNAQSVVVGTQSNGSVVANQNVTIADSTIQGSIKVVKTDAQTGKPVQGAQYTATNTGTEKAYEATTGSNGVAEFTNLPWGTYNVQETKAPNGYELNPQVQTVTINAQSFNASGVFQVPTFNVTDNEVQGSLSVTKLGANNTKLEGAVFTVTGPNNFSKEITTGSNGVASLSNLAWGTYTIKETKAPTGYTLNPEAQTVTIDASNAAKVQNVNVVDGQVTGKLQIVKTNEAGTEKLKGATFTVTGPNGFNKTVITDNNGEANLDNLAWGTYTITETSAPAGYTLNKTPQTVDITGQSASKVQIAIFKDSQVLGSLQVTKTGANNAKLKGAEFTVTGPNGFSKVITTNDEGVASLNDLAWGTYTIKETKAPVGYTLNNQAQTVTIDANNAAKVQNINVVDTQLNGAIQIVKTNEAGTEKLQGATFTVTGPNGFSKTVTTGSNGEANLNDLAWGTYTITETSAPTGYTLNKTPQTIQVTNATVGQVQVATFKDSQVLGNLQIVKTGINNTKLQGATFTVTGPNKFSTTVTTDKNGVASLKDLAWGTYTVTETKAPAGYNLDTTPKTVTIDADNAAKLQTVDVQDSETTGTLVIEKTDITNQKEVAGAKINISGTSLNGQKVDINFTSGTTPTKFTLPAGTYTYKEVDAPVGYQINTTVGHFTIDKQGQIVKADVQDSRILGSLQVIKTGADNAKLPGAEFTITGPNGFSKVVTTNNEGVANLENLAWGTYTVKETKAPVGYKLNDQAQTVTIGADNAAKLQTITVSDKQILGQISITKTNEDGSKKLQGAEFTVTGPNGFSKVVTTNNEGVATLDNLAYGTYTIKETKAPVGYNLNSDTQTVTITKENAAEVKNISEKDTQTTGTLVIEKTDITNQKEVAGAKIEITGTSLTGEKIEKSFTSGTTPTKFTLPAGTYTYKEVDAPVGYQINTTVGHFTIDKQGQIVKADVQDSRVSGSLQIVKTGINDKKLEGAEFTVTGPSGFSKVVTTNNEGVASLNNLAWGTYTVKETKAPAGYNLNTNSQTVTIDANNAAKLQTVNVQDAGTTGTLVIEKTDVTNQKEVAGAKINISGTSFNGQKVDITFTSGTTPTKFTLPAGNYTYKEVDAPVGYQINTTVGHFTIDKQGQIVKANVQDSRVLGQMSITKTGKDNVKLEGAEFTVTGPNGFSKVVTTGKDGVASLNNLAWGTYTVKETKAPVGYNLNSEAQTVTIGANNVAKVQAVNVSDTQILGQISITKTNENGTEKLQGAEFTVTGPNGFNKVVTTDKNGVATLDNLAWGTYSVKETKAPVGYNINPEVQTVTIDANNVTKMQTVTQKDVMTTGTLEIEKTDVTNEKEVAGAKIQITGTSVLGKKVDITFTSGTTPTKFTLPAGTYTYKEVDAPVGYQINTTVGHFTINTQGQIVKANVQDSRVSGSLQIVKTGINDKKLEGAEFTVTGPNGFNKVVTTDKNGVASLSNLGWGTYTIKETKAPAGYNLDTNAQTVTIDASNAAKLQTVNVKDAETTGTLVIEKTDVTNEKEVAGAKINISGTSFNGQKVDITFTSGTTPTKFTLPAGNYTYKEVDAPVGYQINTTVGHFTIDKQGQVVKANVQDSRVLGQMSITKTGKDGVKLEGAEFTVTGPNGFSKVVTTGKDGVASLNNLAWGTYSVKETKAPVGYNLNSQVQKVIIDANDTAKVQAVNVGDTQILGQISITKTNENGTEKLQGAEFTVTGPNGFSKVVTTGKNGVASLDNLAWGTYTVKETKAPVGYNINPEVQTVTIDANNVAKVQNVTQKDVMTTGTLEIEKTDVTNEKEVAGAKIQITGTSVLGKK
ncbi:MAG: SpaA isopeptide-forming pilin-related protein, partial [Clostridium sp.]